MQNSQSRILIAEDNPDMRDLLFTYLDGAGYSVDQAEDGAQAWEMLKKNPSYDAVVADRDMPRLSGLELHARMKDDKTLRHLPLIMQTGMTKPEEVAQGIASGVYYYLAKPWDGDAMVALVRSAIRRYTQHAIFVDRLSKQKDALSHLHHGLFKIKTHDEAQNLALLLGGLFPDAEKAVNGLYELLVNAVEHGNLAIGFELKGKLLATGMLDSEITSRQHLPGNSGKSVQVEFLRHADKMTVTIRDEGVGFDWQSYLQIEPSRAVKSNGRGIAKAYMLYFDRLDYQGNQVMATTLLNK